MLDLIGEVEKYPDLSMVGLIYGLVGFMTLAIVVGWVSKISTERRPTPRKQISIENKHINRKRKSHSTASKKSR